MGEYAFAEDLKALRDEVTASLRRLEEARTPAQETAARADVREAKDSLGDELRRRGLSTADLDKMQEEKEYDRFKTRQERLDREREEERKREEEAEAARLAAEDEGANGKGGKKPAARDGLGGVRNRS